MERNKDHGADWLATNFNSNPTYDLSATSVITEEGRSPFKMYGK